MICKKEKCTGCGLCSVICPHNAIIMKEDNEGFIYPSIDKMKCVNCGLCINKCPSNNIKIKNNKPKVFYMTWSKDKNTVKESSSGGVFVEIAKSILKKGGVIIGCEMNNNEIKHIVVENENDLKKIVGSKYVQSDITKILKIIKKYVNENKIILFSGCPCQVAAIKNLFPMYKNLFTIDLICHGVPAWSFFKKYISEIEEKENSKIIRYIFRKKNKEWRKYRVEYEFENGKVVNKLAMKDPYMACFLNYAIYREACYNCKYSNITRIGDITLGDYSGVSTVEAPKEAIKNGISSCIINNEKGRMLFEDIKEYICYEKKDIDLLIKTNKNLSEPSNRPESRNYIFKDKLNVSELQKKYCKYKKTSLIVNELLSVSLQNKLRKLVKKNEKNSVFK